MNAHPPLTAEYVAAMLRIDMETGIAYWTAPSKYHPDLKGNVAGSANKGRGGKAYWVIRVDGIPYRRSQIVYLMKTGVWPTAMVDHENGNSLDDRPSNLRAATVLQNAWNHKTRAKSSSLPMGIKQTGNGKYQARLGVNKKSISLGTFAALDEAVSAYQQARKQHFGEFA